MKSVVKVVAAQVEIVSLDPVANLKKLRNTIDVVMKKQGIDLIVFPELCNSGYVVGRHAEDFAKFVKKYLSTAEIIPEGKFIKAVMKEAATHNVNIVLGLLEAHPLVPGTVYNSAVLVSSAGELIGIYRKTHIPSEEKHFFYPGNEIKVFPTELGNIAILICADNSFPEAARLAALKGAEIICIPYMRPKGVGADLDLYQRVISTRAFENSCFVVAPNTIGCMGKLEFEGWSGICGPKGEFLARSQSDNEELLFAELRAEDLQVARIHYSRFRDRRPDIYGTLSEGFE